MIIHQNQNGSITERKTSPFKKKIHILSEKMNNEISSYKKNHLEMIYLKSHI